MPGTITFRPVEANLTHDTDWLGKMDPYCRFTIGTQRVKSQVCKHGGTRPHWEDSVTLNSVGNESICHLEVMDKDRFRPDDSIAAADIDLTEIERLGRVSKWYPVYHHRKLAGEILIEAAFQPAQQFIQQPVLVQNVMPVQETFVQERVMTSGPIISETTEVIQGAPIETIGFNQQQFVGQTYEVPTNFASGNLIQGTEFSGLPLNQGTQFSGLPLNQGLGQFSQGQVLSGGNPNYFNAGNVPTTGPIEANTGLLASKTSALGPQGGFPHGHKILGGATNAGYSERPGYTLGKIESNPTTQANLDTNGGGFFNRPGRERRAEPYSLSNPGTYGIPHGQTIDHAGHLHPEVQLNKQAPIGQINRPGYTGYQEGYNSNAGLAQNALNQGALGGLGGQGNTAL